MIKLKLETGKKKIFLLEDEEVLGQLYVKEIQKAGYKVRWLKSTKKVLSSAQDFLPDLFLLDNTIQGEEDSGIDFIPKLKEIFPKVPIVILSNYDQFQLEQEGNLNQVSYFLKIDTPPPILIKRIQDLFSR